MRTLFKTKPIWSFIIITFAITFSLWFLPVIVSLPKDIGFGAMLIGSCGPLLAGYIITVVKSDAKFKIGSVPIFLAIFIGALIVLFFRLHLIGKGADDVNGKLPTIEEISIGGYVLFAILAFILAINASNASYKGLKENYLKSFIFNAAKTKWYILALVVFPVLALASYFLSNAAGMETSESAVDFKAVWLVGFFSTFFFFGGNEEFGWRGFLQKELQKKYNPLLTSFVISFLWSLWHLPLNYNGFYTTGGIVDLLPRFIWTFPLTIVFTWFYNKSKYSVLVVVLLHAMFNNFGRALGSGEILFAVFAILFAIYCIIDDKMWKKKDYHSVYENE